MAKVVKKKAEIFLINTEAEKKMIAEMLKKISQSK